MPDPFKDQATGLDSPARKSFAIATHDANELPSVTRGIYVGVGGDITMRLVGDSQDITWPAVPQGALLPVCAQFVRATGTTASSLIGLA